MTKPPLRDKDVLLRRNTTAYQGYKSADENFEKKKEKEVNKVTVLILTTQVIVYLYQMLYLFTKLLLVLKLKIENQENENNNDKELQGHAKFATESKPSLFKLFCSVLCV